MVIAQKSHNLFFFNKMNPMIHKFLSIKNEHNFWMSVQKMIWRLNLIFLKNYEYKTNCLKGRLI